MILKLPVCGSLSGIKTKKLIAMMVRFGLKRLLFILFSLFFATVSMQGQMRDGKIKKVVIDAGHGGKDPGAMGLRSREKDIALSIALKAGKYISENFPDVEVIYTRKTDEFIELYRRAEIANEQHADLFISIHCNSSTSNKPYGAETYVMGLHKTNANLEVAKTENAAILYEEDYSKKYDGFDPNSPEAHIIFSLYQNAYRSYSLKLASLTQSQIVERSSRFDRGVKEAGFWVLYKTAMPGILIEAGFISNKEEEKYLASEIGQTVIASSVYRAFRDYKTWVASQGGKPIEDVDQGKSEIIADEEVSPKSVVEENQKPSQHDSDVVWRVQVASSPEKISLKSKKFKGLKDIFEYEHQRMYKYTAGAFSTPDSAKKYMSEVRKLGFKDAFVVPFYNDHRISEEQAKDLVKTKQ
ncbi:MAG: N-acetylmuramoyl-L-alanine amidase [Sphingobacteriia bacterium]|nr:N-acetylmuramoyl-L-alanine amidase [Sphingobacteriia bacterium]